MSSLALRFWRDDGGALLSTEWLFLATLLVIGLTTGLVAVRNAVTAELTSTANAIDSLNQCFSFSGLSNCESSVCGSAAVTLLQPQIFTGNTPAASELTSNLSGPCSDIALPATFTGVRSPATAPTTVPRAQPVTPISSETRRPAAECTDEARPSARPVSVERRKEDCTDEELRKMRENSATPAATQTQKKRN